MRESHHLSDQYLLKLLNQCDQGHLIIEKVAHQYIRVTISPPPARQQLIDFANHYHWSRPTPVDRYGFFNIAISDDAVLAQAYKINDDDGSVTLTFPLNKKSDLAHAYLSVQTGKPLSFIYDLQDLLDTLPPPTPTPYISLAYWRAVWQAIMYRCQILLDKQVTATLTFQH